ncbi:MAG: hypothetical protein ACI9LX_002827 [Paraglaciecola sp.]|jgi:hypothetical protein
MASEIIVNNNMVIGINKLSGFCCSDIDKKMDLFMDAHNKHDVEAMLVKTSEDVKWRYNINDKLLI